VHITNKRALLMMGSEPKRVVHAQCPCVLSIDVQHADCGAKPGEVLKTCHGQRTSESDACMVWVDSNDINLAEHWLRVEMQLCPAKSGEIIVDVVKQKTIWIEPRLVLS
jgi:hypothetical protein